MTALSRSRWRYAIVLPIAVFAVVGRCGAHLIRYGWSARDKPSFPEQFCCEGHDVGRFPRGPRISQTQCLRLRKYWSATGTIGRITEQHVMPRTGVEKPRLERISTLKRPTCVNRKLNP